MKKITIEKYLLSLGKLSLLIEMKVKEQDKYISSGVLDIDEIELAETIKWSCKKMLTCVNDQVRSVSEKTSLPWEEVLKKLTEEIKKEIENEKIKTTDNQS